MAVVPTIPVQTRCGLIERGHGRGLVGSMWFVYIHILWFGCWIGFGIEKYPYGLLTMIVSLEAIFLSTFVLISQNRADARHQVSANHQWRTVKQEDKQNEQLIKLSKQILELTRAIHHDTSPQAEAASSSSNGSNNDQPQ